MQDGGLAGGAALLPGPPGADDDILLGDTMGELLLLLGTATVAVIGGSW